MVTMALLPLCLPPLSFPLGVLPPRAEEPKSFLTRGKSVGMQAPMRTQLASMLEGEGLVESYGARGRGLEAHFVQRMTSSTE